MVADTRSIAIDTHQAVMEVREAIGCRNHAVSRVPSLCIIEQTLIATQAESR